MLEEAKHRDSSKDLGADHVEHALTWQISGNSSRNGLEGEQGPCGSTTVKKNLDRSRTVREQVEYIVRVELEAMVGVAATIDGVEFVGVVTGTVDVLVHK